MVSPFRLELPAGSLLFAEGDPPTSAFLIERGEVEISTGEGDSRRVLGVLGPGSLLGEMAVIDDSPRTASARALADCVLTPIDRMQFGERLQNADPVVRALLLSQVARYRSALAQFGGTAAAMGAQVNPLAGNASPAAALDKIRLENELREALDRHQLEVRLQPILDLAIGRIHGFEALTRWTHPERGPVSPADFIALAEETSLILPVGEYVLGEVCLALRRFVDRGDDDPPFIALNVSGRQLADAGFHTRVLERLAALHLDPALLKIEITESLVLDYERVADFIRRCHAAGMRVALDDFGTGYSNLGHVYRLAFDTIKLDQGFVRQLDDPRCLAVVRAVASMAADLGCDLVAEGVEKEEQLVQLGNLGYRFAQGYLIGKPLSVNEALRIR